MFRSRVTRVSQVISGVITYLRSAESCCIPCHGQVFRWDQRFRSRFRWVFLGKRHQCATLHWKKTHTFETPKKPSKPIEAAWWANLAKAVAVKYNGRVAGTFRIFLLDRLQGKSSGKALSILSLMGKTMGLCLEMGYIMLYLKNS